MAKSLGGTAFVGMENWPAWQVEMLTIVNDAYTAFVNAPSQPRPMSPDMQRQAAALTALNQ